MNDFSNLIQQMESGAPLPQVDADDLKRVWHLVHKINAEAGQTIAKSDQRVGIDVRLIAGQCQPGVDVLAGFFRGTLLHYLVREGLLDEWCEGGTPADSVFQAAASFPVKLGDQGFDPEAFINRLRDL